MNGTQSTNHNQRPGFILSSFTAGLLKEEAMFPLHQLSPMPVPVTTLNVKTSGKSNLTNRPHRLCTWTVQWYLPGCASAHPHLIYASLGPHESKSQTASRSVQPFLHGSQHSIPVLYSGLPFALKIALAMGRFAPPSNRWFLGPILVHNPNGISIGSAIFTGLSTVTDRPTDHATQSATTGRIYVRISAMQTNNTNTAQHYRTLCPMRATNAYMHSKTKPKEHSHSAIHHLLANHESSYGFTQLSAKYVLIHSVVTVSETYVFCKNLPSPKPRFFRHNWRFLGSSAC